MAQSCGNLLYSAGIRSHADHSLRLIVFPTAVLTHPALPSHPSPNTQPISPCTCPFPPLRVSPHPTSPPQCILPHFIQSQRIPSHPIVSHSHSSPTYPTPLHPIHCSQRTAAAARHDLRSLTPLHLPERRESKSWVYLGKDRPDKYHADTVGELAALVRSGKVEGGALVRVQVLSSKQSVVSSK